MYKLIIVEDEDIVRSGLVNGTDWHNLGFEVVGAAKNGIEALEMVDNSKPDVVLTDIRMPDMDGIELMRILRHRYPEVEIIILSGHSDFDYAKSAVKYDAYEYLTKPIDEKEFIRTFKEIKKKIRNKRQDYYTKKGDGNELDKDIMRDVFLSAVLTKHISSDLIRKGLIELDIKVNENSYCVAVAQMDFNKVEMNDDIVELFKHECHKHIGNFGYSHIFIEKNCYIIMSKSGAKYYDFKRDLEKIKENLNLSLETHGDITVSIGLSRIHSGFESIYNASIEAQKALSFMFYHGGNIVIPYSDINLKKLDSVKAQQLETLIVDLVDSIINNSINEKTVIANNLFTFIRKLSLSDITFIRIKLMEIFVTLDNKLKQKDIQLEQLSSKDLIYGEIFNKWKLDSLREWFMAKLKAIDSELNKYSSDSSNSLEKQVQQYVYDNIKEKMYLNDIAEAVHMSPNYLSSEFKKQTGQTLSKYIVDLKISKAKEYLALSDMRIQDISEELGFSDYRYFCTVFKNETGQTPLNYRANNHK